MLVTTMENANRWTVTYTKHVKQKRKVYQDGVLEHHMNKVMLYDDGDRLLDSRFMKKDEMIESGGTLAFDGYLVDIGDAEGHHGVLKDINVLREDNKPPEKSGVFHGKTKADERNVEAAQSRRNVMYNIKKEDTKSASFKFGAARAAMNTERGNKKYIPPIIEAPQDHSNLSQTSAREWHILYTTHITQKAKKYHDGILRLELRGLHQKQVMLYDDSNTHLASRFVKKDELIECGGTLSFDGYLVDIGDPKGNHGILKESNIQGVKEKPIEINASHGNRKIDAGNTGSLQNRFHGIYNIKKEDTKSDFYNVGAPQSRQNATKSTERGNQHYRQPKIEASENHPNFSRTSGRAGSADSKIVSSKCGNAAVGARSVKSASENEDTELLNIEEQDDLNMMHDDIGEWHAMYTTQVTQKAKKYHDGILQLAMCGSHRKQVVLLHEDRSVLSKKYLNISAAIRTGSTLQITNYLVEIGEPKVVQGENLQNDASGKHVGSHSGSLIDDKIKRGSDARNNNLDKKSKPIRDAFQILSTLRKPMASESLAPVRKPYMERICSSRSADSFHFELEGKSLGKNAEETKVSTGDPFDNHKHKSTSFIYNQMHGQRSEISQSMAAQNLPTLGIVDTVDCKEELESDPYGICTSKSDVGHPDSESTVKQYSSIGEPQASDGVLDLLNSRKMSFYSSIADSEPSAAALLDLAEKSTPNLFSSTVRPQCSDVLVFESPIDTQTLDTPIKHDGLVETTTVPESHFPASSEGSRGYKSELAEHVEDGYSNQFSADKMGTDTRRKEVSGSGLSTTNLSSCPFEDVESDGHEVPGRIQEERMDLDDFPSFDLGF